LGYRVSEEEEKLMENKLVLKKFEPANVCGGIVQCKFPGITNREGNFLYLVLLF